MKHEEVVGGDPIKISRVTMQRRLEQRQLANVLDQQHSRVSIDRENFRHRRADRFEKSIHVDPRRFCQRFGYELQRARIQR